jgi:glycosyltransferase involved in cell wall biosynthesis
MSQFQVPLVTVLMSCYNSSTWLEEAVNSILGQTFKNFEFLIIDDGSTDNSLSILETLAAQDLRIKLIKKSNTGLADSLNIGLNYAKGKWVARMDADDISEPDRLERQVNFAAFNANLVFLGAGLRVIDEEGIIGSEYVYPVDHKSLLKNLLTSRPFPPHASAFYLRSQALEVGGYRKKIKRAEDCDLWLRLSRRGNLACIKDPLVRIRKHSQQITLSGGGHDAIIDNRLSIISYLAVKSNLTDPIELSDDKFNRFLSWISMRLNSEKYFEYCEWKKEIKKGSGRFKNILFVCKAMKNPFFSFRLIRERLQGDRFGYSALNALLNKSQ